MRNYNFNELLDWREFQNLACEVIQQREQLQLEMYRDGADGGVDGAWFDGERRVCVQAKHYREFSQLYASLQKERLKIERLQPTRYILVVSLALSSTQVQKIHLLLQPFLQSSEDLLTAYNLNSLLSRPEYHYIEKSYVKLWLPHPEVIKGMIDEALDHGVRNESLHEYQEALKACSTFVQSEVYWQARDMLEANHTVIISGEPGMGKTTLAYVLAVGFLRPEQYQGFIWAASIKEIYSQLTNKQQQQVFVLDDFWGSVLGGQKRTEARALEKLIWRIKSMENKRLVITTREYILQQELSQCAELKEVVSRFKIMCVLQGYSDADKARILFAHLRAADLTYEETMLIFRKCDEIVRHPGYSPRIIGHFLAQFDEAERRTLEGSLVDELLYYLDYPEDLWGDIVSELSQEARLLALLVAISELPITLKELRTVFDQYVAVCANSQPDKAFDDCVKELEKTLIITFYDWEYEEIRVELQNPAMTEFLWQYIHNNQAYYGARLVKSSSYYDQLLNIKRACTLRDGAALLLSQRLVGEFYTLPWQLSDSLDWLRDDARDWSARALRLLKACYGQPDGLITGFLQDFVAGFFDQWAARAEEAHCDELVTFAEFLGVCWQRGITFDWRQVLQAFWAHCVLVSHYQALEQLLTVFDDLQPEQLAAYREFMQKNVRQLIVSSLQFYEKEKMDLESDLLMESVQDILQHYQLHMTTRFKEQLEGITGQTLEKINTPTEMAYRARKRLSPEEVRYAQVKASGYQTLFGETVFWEEDELRERVKEAGFDPKTESELVAILDSGRPWYIHDLLTQPKNIDFFHRACQLLNMDIVPENLMIFNAMVIYGITQGDEMITEQLMAIAVDLALAVLCTSEGMLSQSQWEALPTYQKYLRDNDKLLALAEQVFLSAQGKWLTVDNALLALYMFSVTLLQDESLLGAFEFLDEVENEQYVRWLHLLFFEQVPQRFLQEYALARIEKFVGNLDDDGFVQGLLKRAELCLWIKDDRCTGSVCLTSEGQELLNNLADISLMEILETRLTGENLRVLSCQKDLCQEDGEEIRIDIYRAADETFLQYCGISSALQEYGNQALAWLERWRG